MKKVGCVAVILGCVSWLNAATTNTAAPAPKSVEERLQQVETQMQQVLKENAALKEQLGYDPKAPLAFVKAAGKEQKLAIGGLVQGSAEFGGTPDARYVGIEDRFIVRRARVNFGGSFAEHFDFKLEADFGANSLAERTGYSGQLTDVYLNWNQYSFGNVKFGQFKTPFGYEQLVPDPKVLTVERSLPNDRLTDSRQIGLGVAGDFLKKRLGYSVGVFNGSAVNNSFNDNDNFMFAGRLSGVPIQTKWGKQDVRLALAVNSLTTHDTGISKSGFGFDAVTGGTTDNLFTGKRTAWGADAQFTLGRFDLQAEYLQADFAPDNRIPFNSVTANGYYVQGLYYIIPKKLQALVKFESFDPNTKLGGNTSDLWTLGLTYYVKGDDLKFLVNYLIGHPDNISGDTSRLLTRVQFVF